MPIIYPRQKLYTASVKNKTFLNDKTIQLDIHLENPDTMDFIPGQFISLKVSDSSFRAYSISSSNKDNQNISIILTVAHSGVGSNYVRGLKIGNAIHFIGPSGRFHLAEKVTQEIIFMVTGTGIAPVLSMLNELISQSCTSKINVLFGLRSEEDIFAEDFLQECFQKLPNFEYKICISNPSDNWTGLKGRITDFYKIDSPADVQTYICGNPFMVEDVVKLFKHAGVTESQLHREKFTVAAQAKK